MSPRWRFWWSKMQVFIRKNGIVQSRISLPVMPPLWMLEHKLKRRFSKEEKKKWKLFFRSIQPLLKEYPGWRLVEVRQQDGTEIEITL